MLQRLRRAEDRFLQIEQLLATPEVTADAQRLHALMKEYNDLAPIVECYRKYTALAEERASALSLYEDALAEKELRDLAYEEATALAEEMARTLDEAEILLLPKDENADRDVIMEIRGCAGGEEAALFAAVLYRMYSMYAAQNGFRIELLSVNPTELGGYKEIDFQISGTGAYAKFKYESGVHRVQRVPQTESQGRIQTSTATVAVLPVVEDAKIEINPADIVMETCRASGAGGQHINKTDSAVRLIHKPSGIVVECQEERSQFKNRDKAMKRLRAKLYDIKCREQHEQIASERRMQVGTGDRSERIRTYNYPQGRLTDHRIGLTLHTLDRILNGELEEILAALTRAEIALLLQNEHKDR
ncbi:MAG: peptide chain release factor 1 [Clostridia bacterium]|nr:peptide chain release factor 1 [Clostridia bacterium]